MLKAAFHEHLDWDLMTIDGLFNVCDHQNVPNTIKLLQAVYELTQKPAFSSLPINHPAVLLEELLGCFILPYIDPTYTLSQQLISLSAVAHTTLVLFHMDTTSFITGQLGYNIPTTCKKNVYWCVAKQKVMNPSGKLHIGQVGSDHLEGNFGLYQTVKGSPNFDLKQLGDQARAMYTLSSILACEVSWNCGLRCLHLSGAEGVDHTNPKLWLGDVFVGGVSLLACWNVSHYHSTQMLSAANINVDFIKVVGPTPDIRTSMVRTGTKTTVMPKYSLVQSSQLGSRSYQ